MNLKIIQRNAIGDPVLVRGAEPRAALDNLRMAYGVTDIICLQSGWFDHFNELLRGRRPRLHELRELAGAMGISVHYLPLSDFRAPNEKETLEFRTRVDELIARERVVYFHCLHGKDRTGWMCAAWRIMRQGWDIERAISEWHEMGHHRRWYFWWTGRFRKMMARWSL